MKDVIWYSLLITFMAANWLSTSAQQKDSVLLSSIRGQIIDSSQNFVLVSATLAIYHVNDSSLIAYQLSNSLGEFTFKRLPIGTPLRLVVSYTGYEREIRSFIISTTKDLVMPPIKMKRIATQLKEVTIAFVPPVRMNGDTLEFNADAFKLNPHAQAEDLLRSLPGITVWGDGTITSNGKNISRVLVNGKPFFGTDARIATQNLPKQIIEKVQIYQAPGTLETPNDSIAEMNIKTKKGGEMGYFGKISTGYGSSQRYELEGSINWYSPRTQIGIGTFVNNVNKIAKDMEALFRKSTYKGVGASIEFNPDFLRQGRNNYYLAGLTFQHDFVAHPDYFKADRLDADYSFKGEEESMQQEVQTSMLLGNNELLTQKSAVNTNKKEVSHDLSSKYEKKKGGNKLVVSSQVSDQHNNDKGDQQTTILSKESINSTNLIVSKVNEHSKKAAIDTKFSHAGTEQLPAFDITYRLNVSDMDEGRVNETKFTSYVDSTQNKFFNRIYDSHNAAATNQVIIKMYDLLPFLFRKDAGNNKISLGIENDIRLGTERHNVLTSDIDTNAGKYIQNKGLSYDSRYNIRSYQPAIVLSKRIFSGLANRYQRELAIFVSIRSQLYRQSNESNHEFQEFSRDYFRFVPEASFEYINKKISVYQDKYKLDFKSFYDYPTVQQLFPLIDSVNVFYIVVGNPLLKPQATRELNFNFSHSSDRLRGSLYYMFNLRTRKLYNYYGDYSSTDSLGRSTHSAVNMSGHGLIEISGHFNRAFKFKTSQLQLSTAVTGGLSKIPNYVNGIYNHSDNTIISGNAYVHYAYKDFLAAYLGQSFNFYNSIQSGLGEYSFMSRQSATTISMSANFWNMVTINNSIAFNNNSSKGAKDLNFVIWNLSVATRFLKRRTAEVSLSALDLLRQNKGIINYGFGNSLSFGTTNVLRQYFMLTLTYFPRKFGNNQSPRNE